MINPLSYIPNSVTSAVGRTILQTQKSSPTILFATGVVGVVATAVMASRATLQSSKIIDEHKNDLAMSKDLAAEGREDYTEKDLEKDIVTLYARTTVNLTKLYGPTLLVGFLSIAALTGSHHILSKRNAGLTAAYAVLDKAYTEYRRRVVDELGEEQDFRFRHGVETQRLTQKGSDGTHQVDVLRLGGNTPSGYARFFDELCSSWSKTPEYNLIFLRCQQSYANDKLQARGHMFLNEVYDMLGIERSSAGSVVGWTISKTGDNYIDFGVFNGDSPRARDFVNGREGAILLDFNVDGVIYDKI